ncbi:MAG TPA: hypothetical protein VGV35_01150 [Bryobacteraceae bacterium]|nr:hypothetical protein [Bryobacteraceae bacterium]
MRRHIDFFAVIFIALVMMAFSKAATMKPLPADVYSIRVQNAANAANSDACPISQAMASLASILDQ